MTLRKLLTLSVVACGVALMSSAARAQDPAAKPRDAKPASKSPKAKDPHAGHDHSKHDHGDHDHGDHDHADHDHGGMSPEMEAMMKAGMPGKEHELLQGMVGSWKAESKWWMSPEAPPIPGTADVENKSIWGGRFIQTKYVDSSPEHSWEGMGLNGYDNVKKQYISFWGDSNSTGLMISYGTYDPASKSFTYTGEYDDPLTGKPVEVRMVTKLLSDSQSTFEMFEKRNGKESKSLEIMYTRK